MTYGRRLNQALLLSGKDRKSLAAALEVTPQAIGMVINGPGQLSFENNLKAAKFLKVDSEWLRVGGDDMRKAAPPAPNSPASYGAQELGLLFDMIPESDRIKRTQAFNLASAAIVSVLQADQKTPVPAPDQKTQAD